MEVKNLQALIVLRNHAQAILNGARADLKLSKEDKSSLMNGLKKVDEIFIKKFESAVQSVNFAAAPRTWTSTQSEEEVLNKALKQINNSDTDLTFKSAVVGSSTQSNAEITTATSEATEPGSVVKTVPVTTLEKTKKTKKGFSRAQ